MLWILYGRKQQSQLFFRMDIYEARVLRSAILHLLVVSFRSNDIWIPFESIHDLCIGKLVLHYVCLLYTFKVNLPGTSKIHIKYGHVHEEPGSITFQTFIFYGYRT